MMHRPSTSGACWDVPTASAGGPGQAIQERWSVLRADAFKVTWFCLGLRLLSSD